MGENTAKSPLVKELSDYYPKIDQLIEKFSLRFTRYAKSNNPDEFKINILNLFSENLENNDGILNDKENKEDLYFYFTEQFQKYLDKNNIKLQIPGMKANNMSPTASAKQESKSSNYENLVKNFDVYDKEYTWSDFILEWHEQRLTEENMSEKLNKLLTDLSKVYRYSLSGRKWLSVTKSYNEYNVLEKSDNSHVYFYQFIGLKSVKITLEDLCFKYFRETRIFTGPVVFNPELPIETKKIFNLWRGYKAKKLEKYDINAVQFIIDHVRLLVKTEEAVIWILSWLAWIIKYPGKKTGKCLIMISGQGTGKSFIGELMCEYVIGFQHSYTSGFDKIVQRFNSCKEAKTFIDIEEMQVEHSTQKQVFGTLKAIITSKTQAIENKNIDATQYRDYTNIYASANHQDNPIHVEGDDRRFCIPDIVSKDQLPGKDYYKGIFNKLSSSVGDQFYTFLLNYNEIDVSTHENIPESYTKKELIQYSYPTSLVFIDLILSPKFKLKNYGHFGLLYTLELKQKDPENGYWINKEDFYQLYISWLRGETADKRHVFWKNVGPSIRELQKKPPSRFEKMRLPIHCNKWMAELISRCKETEEVKKAEEPPDI